MDTIFALATAAGKAGVAVVRISGPKARVAAGLLGATVPEDGRGVRQLCFDGGLLDEALVLDFSEGRSFTGEEVIELHLHGGRAIIASVLDALETIDGLRGAEAGEFTRRAFENGRLDLTQVEGLADLIEAETTAQKRLAERLFSGDLRKRAEDWHHELLGVQALFAASIDFADEDIPDTVIDDADRKLVHLITTLETEIAGFSAAELIRDGFEVAIVGAPNAGKSTLLNRIAGREAALVSDIAGTTRDVIELRLDLGGYSVVLLDTAGLRDGDDVVEQMGIARAIERAQGADMRVFLVSESPIEGLDPQPGDLVLKAKADQGGGVSGLTGQGVDDMLKQIKTRVQERCSGAGLVVRARQRAALESAVGRLKDARRQVTGGDPVIAAELVRGASCDIEALVGRIDVESVLAQIFSSFCVGK